MTPTIAIKTIVSTNIYRKPDASPSIVITAGTLSGQEAALFISNLQYAMDEVRRIAADALTPKESK